MTCTDVSFPIPSDLRVDDDDNDANDDDVDDANNDDEECYLK